MLVKFPSRGSEVWIFIKFVCVMTSSLGGLFGSIILIFLCMPSLLVCFMWGTSCTLLIIWWLLLFHLSICEELVCNFLALFSYPYVRNSYVLMLYFLCWSTHIFYIASNCENWLRIFMMIYSVPLINLWMVLIYSFISCWYEYLYYAFDWSYLWVAYS